MKEKKTAFVRVSPKIKARVEKKVAGTNESIGDFYDRGASELLKPKPKTILL